MMHLFRVENYFGEGDYLNEVKLEISGQNFWQQASTVKPAMLTYL